MTRVILKKGEGRTVEAGGFWVYDNEIESIMGEYEDGDIVEVAASNAYFLGYGYINRHSKIRIRLLSREREALPDEALLAERVRRAWEYRKAVMEDTSSCRVIYSEADYLPGLVVDKYEDVLVAEVETLGMERRKEALFAALERCFAQDGYTLRGIYERNDARVREKEGLERYKGYYGEPFEPRVEISENGVRYIVDLEDGQKTGFFLDQKRNRREIQRLCRGKRVLDCFTHTGSFALNAGIAGAAEVLGVDASEAAVRQARENAELNGLAERVKFQTADVLELLPQLEAAGERYDIVILDPPAFTKSAASVKNAVRGYRDINLRGLRLVETGGFLATCSCSHFMEPELFARTIQEAARGARVQLRQVYFGTQAPDHPILWTAKSSYYLKFYIFQVLRER